MELNFFLLVVAALAGMIVKLFAGWDPWKLLGSLSLVLLFLPMLSLAFVTDPQVAQTAANSLVERVAGAFPSIIIGEVAGVFAGTIFGAIRGLFKGW